MLKLAHSDSADSGNLLGRRIGVGSSTDGFCRANLLTGIASVFDFSTLRTLVHNCEKCYSNLTVATEIAICSGLDVDQ